MRNNFWQNLKKTGRPILALAPMAGVTDIAFRQICKSYGADVLYSEMASAAALNYKPEKTLELVKFESGVESPFVVQLFGAKPEHFAKATKIISETIKPDGLDINFGCPVPKVRKQGAGAVLMGDQILAKELMAAVIENTDLPVSIKIRARMEKGEGDAKRRVDALEFLAALAGLPIAAVMIHGRSMAQGHSGSVDFDIIKQAKKLVGGVLLANGGVVGLDSAKELLAKTGADGLGIARGAIGRPWLFQEIRQGSILIMERKEIFVTALAQARLAHKHLGRNGLIEMRKHLAAYLKGQPAASELRQKLMAIENIDEVAFLLKLEEGVDGD